MKRVEYFESAARKQVGKKGVEDGRRKVRVDMVEGSERGGSLELVVVKGDQVFLVCRAYIPRTSGGMGRDADTY
jgi:hypothetical protein